MVDLGDLDPVSGLPLEKYGVFASVFLIIGCIWNAYYLSCETVSVFVAVFALSANLIDG